MCPIYESSKMKESVRIHMKFIEPQIELNLNGGERFRDGFVLRIYGEKWIKYPQLRYNF